MTNDEQKQRFREFCKFHGCKCTPQRFAVFAYMEGNLNHPSVNQVWEAIRSQLPSITRESVFRILNEFSDFGFIARMYKSDFTRFDSRPLNHGHLLCEECGTIIDFDLPNELEHTVVPDGCQVNHIDLSLSGLCAKCAQKAAPKPPHKKTM